MITLPLSYSTRTDELAGGTWGEVKSFYPGDQIRQIERASIRAFMEKQSGYLKGRVLDFGAGKQPYRDLVDGEYVPYEKGDQIPKEPFDAVMLNQVIQYHEMPGILLEDCWGALKLGGYLVATYCSCWCEIETNDYWRFTKVGMERMLSYVKFSLKSHELRAEINMNGFRFPLGYGVVAQK